MKERDGAGKVEGRGGSRRVNFGKGRRKEIKIRFFKSRNGSSRKKEEEK